MSINESLMPPDLSPAVDHKYRQNADNILEALGLDLLPINPQGLWVPDLFREERGWPLKPHLLTKLAAAGRTLGAALDMVPISAAEGEEPLTSQRAAAYFLKQLLAMVKSRDKKRRGDHITPTDVLNCVHSFDTQIRGNRDAFVRRAKAVTLDKIPRRVWDRSAPSADPAATESASASSSVPQSAPTLPSELQATAVQEEVEKEPTSLSNLLATAGQEEVERRRQKRKMALSFGSSPLRGESAAQGLRADHRKRRKTPVAAEDSDDEPETTSGYKPQSSDYGDADMLMDFGAESDDDDDDDNDEELRTGAVDESKAADEDDDRDSVWDSMEAEAGEHSFPTAERPQYGEMLTSATYFLDSIRGELNPPR